MASTPLFVISQVGLNVASHAMPEGPYIHVTKFAVGSAYGYTVTPDQTSLNGDLLYEGTISSYSYVGDNIINLICKLPADAGPFDFGEVAIYLDDGTMFAKAAFSSLQTKYSSLGTNLGLTYTFNCLLKLEQSVAVFQIDSGGLDNTTVLNLSAWTEVVPPELSANPNVPLLVVQELDGNGNGTLLVQSSNTKWTPASTFYPLGTFAIENASNTWIEVNVSNWPYLNSSITPYDVEACSFVVETESGYFRSVASIQHMGDPATSVRFLLNPEVLPEIPPPGATVVLHINDSAIKYSHQLWKNVIQLLANSGTNVSALTVNANKSALTASIEGAGIATSSVSVSAVGNAPYSYQWSNVVGNASFSMPNSPATQVSCQLANGGYSSGTVRCVVTDSLGLTASVSIPWSYTASLAWVVPTQAMFPGCTAFEFNTTTKKAKITYAVAGVFSFTPPNDYTEASAIIKGAGGGGSGGASIPGGNANYQWGGGGSGGGGGACDKKTGLQFTANVPIEIKVGKGGIGGAGVAIGRAGSGLVGEASVAFGSSVPGGMGAEGAYSYCCGSDPGPSTPGGGAGPSGRTGGSGSRTGTGPAGTVVVNGTIAQGANHGSLGVGSLGAGGGGGGADGQIGGAGGLSAGEKGGGGGGGMVDENNIAYAGFAGGDGEIIIEI